MSRWSWKILLTVSWDRMESCCLDSAWGEGNRGRQLIVSLKDPWLLSWETKDRRLLTENTQSKRREKDHKSLDYSVRLSWKETDGMSQEPVNQTSQRFLSETFPGESLWLFPWLTYTGNDAICQSILVFAEKHRFIAQLQKKSLGSFLPDMKFNRSNKMLSANKSCESQHLISEGLH